MPEVRSGARDARLRRLRVDLGTIITVGVLGQAALLIGLGYWGVQRIVGTLAASVHQADHQRVEERIRAYLDKGVAAARILSATPELQPVGPASNASARLMWTVLAETPELDSVYVANDLGRMLMVLRYPEPAVRRIAREADHTEERWEYKLAEGYGGSASERFATQRVVERQTQYNPLARAWYLGATQSGRPFWSAPYLFDAARELGVTYAIAEQRIEAGADRTQVVAVDFTLGRLSEFVRQFSRAGLGQSALLSGQDAVLARSDRDTPVTELAVPSGDVLAAVVDELRLSPDVRNSFSMHFDGETYFVRTSLVARTGWALVSWVSEREVLGRLRGGVLWALGAALGFLALALLLSLRMARGVTRPIEQLARNARLIGQLRGAELQRVDSRVLELHHLDQALDESARALDAFAKFVPVDIVSKLIDQGDSLGPSGQPRELTVMFTDVRGFSHIAETLAPQQLVAQLTEYFNVAAEVIGRHGGTIDKFIGDGILVLWGAPAPLPDAALQACRAALALQQALDALNAGWRAAGKPCFETCIGIHTGPVVAGVLGSADRLSYTALGDTVNVASRVEDLNRTLGTRILISETTQAALHSRLPTRSIGSVALRGRQRPLQVSELLET